MAKKNKDKGRKIQFFSDDTNKFYQLYFAKEGEAPVLRINGVPMHRFIKISPVDDAKLKVKSLNPKGKVLEICTGLGYLAIEIAHLPQVNQIVTVEKDFEVVHMAKQNPFSAELFSNKKIVLLEGDAVYVMSEFLDNEFDFIFHDPPTFIMAPDLYTVSFYKKIFRILKKGGRLWHYAPMPGKAKGPEVGNLVINRILKRLKEVGFEVIGHDITSMGIVARKP